MGNYWYASFLYSHFLRDLFNQFISFEDVLKAVSSVTIAEVARDNKEVQDAMAMEGDIPPLVALFKGKQLNSLYCNYKHFLKYFLNCGQIHIRKFAIINRF